MGEGVLVILTRHSTVNVCLFINCREREREKGAREVKQRDAEREIKIFDFH